MGRWWSAWPPSRNMDVFPKHPQERPLFRELLDGITSLFGHGLVLWLLNYSEEKL